MKVKPYINFNGNCAEAIKLYEAAFGEKALVMKMSDAPADEGYTLPPGAENQIMHASITFGNDHCILLSDCPPEYPVEFANAVSVYLEFENVNKFNSAWNVLKNGGAVSMEPTTTFFSKYFGMLTDKFGVNWIFAVMEE